MNAFTPITGVSSRCEVCFKADFPRYKVAPTSQYRHLKSDQHKEALVLQATRMHVEEEFLSRSPSPHGGNVSGGDENNGGFDGPEDLWEDVPDKAPEVRFESDFEDDDEEDFFLFESDEEDESDGENEGSDDEAEAKSSAAELEEFLRKAQEQTSSNDYAPWPSKGFLLCDLITRLPRQRISRSLQKILWWWAKELGAKGLPSPKVLADFQKKMLEKEGIGAPPVAHEGVLGNVTYCADLKKLFSQNLSNPVVLSQLHLRPEDTIHNVRGLFQGKKWARELKPQLVAPMIVAAGQCAYKRTGNIADPLLTALPDQKHYYLDEILYREVSPTEENPYAEDPNWDNHYFWPREWVFNEDHVVETKGLPVWRNLAEGSFYVQILPDRVQIPTTSFVRPYPEILESMGGAHPQVHIFKNGVETKVDVATFNPAREKANGLRRVTVPASLYGDGVGGIKGSTWDEHTVWYMSLVGLEPEALGQEFHLHFLSTSNTAHQQEMLTAIVDEIVRANEEGIIARFPAGTLENQPEAEDVLIDLLLLFLEGDNPFHSEISSTPLLSKATYFCRFGMASLPSKSRDPEQIKGYITLEGCPPRNFRDTAHIAHGVFDKAASPGGTFNVVTTAMRNEGVKDWLNFTIIENTLNREKAADADVEDSTSTDGPLQALIEEFRKMLADASDEIEGDDHFFNPLYRLIDSMQFDAHKDTPIEILHTILLGFFKYLWRHICVEVFRRKGARGKAEMGARLASVSVDGIGCAPLRGPKLVDYARSLIGRDLKILGQLAIFVIEPFATPQELGMWSSLMHLTSLIWYPVIPDMKTHGDKIDAAVAAFFAAAILTDIDWLTMRKHHLLVHLRQSMERIGPPLLASTQKQESYNGVFREHSIYSSKRNAGYEIGLAFAHHNRFQHVMSGGFWRSPSTGKWRQAGSKAIEMFTTNAQVRGLLGLHDQAKPQPGAQTQTLRFRIPKANKHCNSIQGHLVFRLAPDPDPEWPDIQPANSITSHQSLEPCYHNSFVLIQAKSTAPITIGRIRQVGRLHSSGKTVVRIERFKHHDHCWSLDMPRIRSENSYSFIQPAHILAPINVQHDCFRLGCKMTTMVPNRGPEGQISSKRRATPTHEESSIHIVNTGSLRNGLLIHTAFPRPPRPVLPLDELIDQALEHQVAVDKEKAARKAGEKGAKKKAGGAPVTNKPRKRATQGRSQGKGKGKQKEDEPGTTDEERATVASHTSDDEDDAPEPIQSRTGRTIKRVVKNLPVVVKGTRKRKNNSIEK